MEIKNESIGNRIGKYVFVLLCIYFIIYSVSCAFFEVPDFDGAMNLQVSQNVLRTGEYATLYNNKVMFDHKIQTGAPIIFLTSIMFMFFGENFVSALTINALFYVLLLICINIYIKLKFNNYWYMIITSISIVSIPLIHRFVFGLYGEIPTIAFYFLSVIFYTKLLSKPQKNYAILTGIFYALAYLTKTVILVTLPAFIIISIIDVMYTKRIRIAHYLYIFVSFISIILGFEVYKLLQLGLNNYFAWWSQELGGILKQAGVKKGYGDTNNILNKIVMHFSLFCRDFTYNKVLLTIVLLANTMIPIQFLKNIITKSKKYIYLDELYLWISMMSYLLWWIIISPTEKAWARRVVNADILLIVTTVISFTIVYKIVIMQIGYLNKASNKKATLVNMLIIVFFVSLFSFSFINIKNLPKVLTGNTSEKHDVLNISAKVKELPTNARIYGYDWWQSPIISFGSNRIFYDLSKTTIPVNTRLIDSYLVIDKFAHSAGKGQIEPMSKLYNLNFIEQYGDNYLYKIESMVDIYNNDEIIKKEMSEIDNTGILESIQIGYKVRGNIDVLRNNENDKFYMRGWLFSQEKDIEKIIIMNQDSKVIGVANYGYERPDVQMSLNSADALRVGWDAYFRINESDSSISLVIRTKEGKYINIKNFHKELRNVTNNGQKPSSTSSSIELEDMLLKKASITKDTDIGYEIKGNIDVFKYISEGNIQIMGWLYSIANDIDKIIIVNQDYNVIALAEYGLERRDVEQYLKDEKGLKTGWLAYLKVNESDESVIVILRTKNGKYIELTNYKKSIEKR